MKRLAVILIALGFFMACKNDNNAKAGSPDSSLPLPEKSSRLGRTTKQVDTASFTTVQWLDSLKDFGSVQDGEKVDVVFRFRNTGDKPLIVQEVHAGCGCTVPEYSKEPVMPGKMGYIKAVFNSSGQAPTVHKTVSTTMNTKPTQYHNLAFVGEVRK